MIDLKLVRKDPQRYRDSLRLRGVAADLEGLLGRDEDHRHLIAEVEKKRAEQNRLSKEIASAAPEARGAAIAGAKRNSEELAGLEERLKQLRLEIEEEASRLPNFVHPDVPEGSSDEDNRVLREVGVRREFDFQAADHLTLGEALDVIDTTRAAKIAGTRFGILRGGAAILEMALMRFAIDRAAQEGFAPVIPPALVREDVLFGMGFFPDSRDEAYEIPRDGLFLAGTSEAPLAGMHAGEMLPPAMLPLRYTAFSSCFRREAGTYGRDTRGIIRVHQFEKVEMFVYCRPEDSDSEHLRILSIEEAIFQALEIPYRVVDVCAGELGAPYSRKFDLEAWLPGSQRWMEVTSCSNGLDFQARRLGVRTKKANGTELVHTLNGTAVTNRAIVALFENHQQGDGSIALPPSLHSYTGFEAIKG